MSQRQPKMAGEVVHPDWTVRAFPPAIGYLWVTDNLQIQLARKYPNGWWRFWQYAFFGFKYTRLRPK